MSKKNEHIDKLFSDKLKQAEVSPPPGLWNDIEASLDAQAVNRRLIPVWFRYAAAAAVVALFVISGVLYLNTTPDVEPTEQSIIKVDSVTEQPEVEELVEDQIEEVIIEDVIIPDQKTVVAQVSPSNESKSTTEIVKRDLLGVIKLLKSKKSFTRVKESASKNYGRLTEADLREAKKRLEEYHGGFVDRVVSVSIKKTKWAIAMGGSPSLESRSFSSGGEDMMYAPNIADFYDVSSTTVPIFGEESRLNSFTWGVDVYLSINDKWSFKSGVYYLNQGRNIGNYSALFNTLSYNTTMDVNTSSGNIRVDNSMFLTDNSVLNEEVDLTDATSAANYNSDLIQRFSYLEIPFNFNYHLVDQKMKISLSAGLNAAILIGNSVYLKGFENQKVGETEDLNNILYKGVLGFNIHYPIIDKLYLNISPSYKYQFNDVNKINARNERVTYFDFKTGLSYWF